MKSDILLTNDDGIHSRGLTALEESLAPLGNVITVAPDREMSATSHRITMHQPLRFISRSAAIGMQWKVRRPTA